MHLRWLVNGPRQDLDSGVWLSIVFPTGTMVMRRQTLAIIDVARISLGSFDQKTINIPQGTPQSIPQNNPHRYRKTPQLAFGRDAKGWAGGGGVSVASP